jgi:hypothetical protein
MRGAPFAAALLLALAGCSLGTEGAPCRSTDNCAEGLACGGSGTCTRAAARCGDLGNRPLCKVGELRCGAGDTVLQECKGDDRGEECASFQQSQVCTSRQSCGPRPGDGALACNCAAAPRCEAVTAFCDGNVPTDCIDEPSAGCRYEAPRPDCGTSRTCTPDTVAGTASCVCKDALECAGRAAGETVCGADGRLVSCKVVDGCPFEDTRSDCGFSQECVTPAAGAAKCDCKQNGGCAPAVASLCDGQGKLIPCVTEANGCRHPAAQAVSCSTVHQTCSAAAGAEGQCQCLTDRCTGGALSFCDAGKLVTCARDTASCEFEGPPTDCLDPGRSCVQTSASPLTAACQCPDEGAAADQGCLAAGQGQRSCAGAAVLVCAPKAIGSSCLVWKPSDTCAAPMTCSAGACACPVVSDGVFWADRAGGTPFPAPPGSPTPTGAQDPAACRFASIEEALARANAVPAGGGEVRATGASPIAPMTFVATGALSVGAGVTVTTTDSPLGTANYTLQAPAGLGTNAFVTLGAGASLSGFHIQSGGSTGAALVTNCATGIADRVLVDTVRISGAGSFSAGISHASPDCPVTLRNADVSGVGHGVDLLAGSLAVEGGAFSGNVTHVHAQPGAGASVDLTVGGATMSGAADSAVRLIALGAGSRVALNANQVQGNSFTTTFNVAVGPRRGAGGIVLTAPFPASIVFTGNTLRSNAGDQFFVAASSGTVVLRGDLACGSSPLVNRFGCYISGVGMYSNGAIVHVGGNSWTQQPGVLGVDVGGTGVDEYDTDACAPTAFTCP